MENEHKCPLALIKNSEYLLYGTLVVCNNQIVDFKFKYDGKPFFSPNPVMKLHIVM